LAPPVQDDSIATALTDQRHFARRFTTALIAGLVAACVLSPFAAWGVAAAGLRFPFPRIFDRTMMATLLIALLASARKLHFVELLREGFADLWARRYDLMIGLAISLTMVAILFALAAASGCGHLLPILPLIGRGLKYAASAVLIGIIEEAFFRAFLLGGLRFDFGRRTALLASAAVYALAHVLRSPAHIYLTGYHPLAGFNNLTLSAARLAHPLMILPALIGLLLLGIVLGAAFIATGRVYLAIGLHAGFVLGAKTWPIIVNHPPPRWLAGPGPVPLIAAPAAWLAAILIALMLARMMRRAT